MGLTMVGRTKEDSNFIEEMRSYAHETAHEKIIRGLAMGMAITQYGVEESADELIDTLLSDKDPILRYGAMYMIGLAYCGTANSFAIRKLLGVAVSDVSDDVRRAAVTNLGFLLYNTPKQCPRLVNLLAESYNPHVRYGAALAIGIACAGTGLEEAIEILEPLSKDRVDFVRQGALISLAMVLIQLPESHAKVLQVRKLIEKSWTGRQEVMSKMGGILANGIIDAGGRNVTIGLTKNGHNRMNGIIGMALFTQYWFWYPYLHYLSLTFDPTCVIGLNQSLKMPEFQFKSNAKPSMFSYPPNKKEPEKKTVVLAPTAQLSTSQKEKAKEERKKKKSESMDDGEMTPSHLTSPRETPKTPFSDTPSPFSLKKKEIFVDVEEVKEKVVEPEKKKEPEFEILQNPSRIIPSQLKYLSFDNVNSKYVPLKEQMGLILLFNKKPNEEEILVEMKSYSSDGSSNDEKEPEAPKAFNFP
jgi:26S proteasome regulatory subunit N2